jgi:hypothetical protein
MKKVAGFIALMAFAIGANAEGLDPSRFYLGGGFSANNLAGVGCARGYLFFGGFYINLKINDDISSALEVGYMDSGDFDRYDGPTYSDNATGVWFAALESAPLTKKTDMLVRVGYDFGDDDGLILGTGLQYKFDTKVALRMEYVTRDHIDGLQANVLVHFN